nr:hypothetical protein [Tanacetum cinerariifolium]
HISAVSPSSRFDGTSGEILSSHGNVKIIFERNDVRDIWNAVKARLGGNTESKKMRKSMLKQEFLEFRIGKAEGLHKRYDRMQKILSQLNQLKAKPEDEDIKKFLRALPSSWSQVALTLKTKGGLKQLSFDDLYYKLKTLKVDVKGYTTFSSSQSTRPSYSAFVSATSASKKMSYGDSLNYSSTTTYSVPSNSKTWSHRSEFGMIAGCDTDDVIEESAAKIYNLITVADTKEANTSGDAGEFALMGLTSELTLEDKIRVLSIELENTSNLLKHSERINADVKTAKRDLQTKLDNHLIQTEKWRNSSKNLFRLIDSRPLFHRFAKADSMKVVPPPLFGDYTSLLDHSDLDESQMSYGTKSSTSSDFKSVSNDFVSCDDSDKSSEVNPNDFASSDSSVKSLEPKPNNSTSCASTSSISTSENEAEIESNVRTPIQDPIIVQDLPSFSCNSSDKNENTSRTSCNKNGYFNKKACHFRKHASSVSKNKVNHQNQFVPQAVLLRTGKINIPHARPQPVPTGKPKVFAPVPAGRQNRPFPVPTDRGHSSSENPFSDAEVKGIFDSGCSRSMTVDESVKWHRRMGHVNYKNMNRLVKGNLVRGLPPKLFKNDHTCVACCKEHKDETYPILKDFINLVENQLNKKVKAIRCDNGTEFKNAHMIELCGSKGIKREYSNARTLQQNGVAERKNRTLIEAARTIPYNKTPYALLTGNIPSISHFKPFGCYVTILNTSDHLGKFDRKADEGYIVGYSASNKAYRVYNVPNKRVEESMNLRFLKEKPNVQGLGHECYFDLDYLTDTLSYKHVQANQSAGIQRATTNPAGTQDANSDFDCDKQVILVPSYPSYSIQGTEPKDTSGDEVDYSLLNSVDEIFQKELARLKGQEQNATSNAGSLGLSIPVSTGYIPVPAGATMVSTDDVLVHTSSSTDSFFDDEPTTRFPCPLDLGNHDPSPGIFSSSSYDDEFGAALDNVASTMERDNHTDFQHCLFACFLSQVKPHSVAQALEDPSWVDAMQEEMQLFKFQNVWVLVDLPVGKYVIGTKQEEGIDYDEVFAPVARIEAIRLFLAFDSYMGFMVYQMDVKSVFLYERIDEEQRPDGIFINQDKYVQEILHKFDLGSVRIATTPYEAPKPKSKNESDSLVNVYLYRSMIGLLMYLIASRPDIMFAVSACSRNQVAPTTSNLEAVKKIFKYLKGQPKLGLWNPRESPFVLEAYSDSDYAGANKDRTSTTGGCQFLGRRLILWQCKKQTIVATSSIKAKYVAAAKCCGQPNGSRRWISAFQVLYMDQVALF